MKRKTIWRLGGAGKLASALVLGLALAGCSDNNSNGNLETRVVAEQKQENKKQETKASYRGVVKSEYPFVFYGFGKDGVLYTINKSGETAINYENAMVFSAPLDGLTVHDKDSEKNKPRRVVDVSDNARIDLMYPHPNGIVALAGLKTPEKTRFYFYDAQGNELRAGINADLQELVDGILKETGKKMNYPNVIYDFGQAPYSDGSGFYCLGDENSENGYFIPCDGSKIVSLDKTPERISERDRLRADLNRRLGNKSLNYPCQIRTTNKGLEIISSSYSKERGGRLEIGTIKKEDLPDYSAFQDAYSEK